MVTLDQVLKPEGTIDVDTPDSTPAPKWFPSGSTLAVQGDTLVSAMITPGTPTAEQLVDHSAAEEKKLEDELAKDMERMTKSDRDKWLKNNLDYAIKNNNEKDIRIFSNLIERERQREAGEAQKKKEAEIAASIEFEKKYKAYVESQKQSVKESARILKDLVKGIHDAVNATNTKTHVFKSVIGVGAAPAEYAVKGSTYIGNANGHVKWQDDVPARKNVMDGNTKLDENGLSKIGPADWIAAHDDVVSRRDPTGGQWGNCAEQAATIAAEIMVKIEKDPNFAGCKVRQVWVPGPHSWAEVKTPSGEVYICDPWGNIFGKPGSDAVSDLNKYYNNQVRVNSKWYP